ncbi:MAG: glycosyltransferase family 39 protein [Candidatus Woesearchaeota archaeon]|nr:glycosyltransferase family 39 protein [Candidatus Woesearchaeota archaeon]
MMLKQKTEYLFVAAIFSVAFFLRIYKLGEFSLWNDEFVIMMHHSKNVNLNALLIEPHPPLYFIFFGIWTSIFGISAFAIRFPSVIFSICSLFFFYLFAKKLFGSKVGIVSLALASFSNILINFSMEAKNYSLLFLLLNASFYYYLDVIRNGRNKMAYFLSITLALLTHYSAIFVVFFQIAYALMRRKICFNDLIYLSILNAISFATLIYNLIYNNAAFNWIGAFTYDTLPVTLNFFSGIFVRHAQRSLANITILFLIFMFIGMLYSFRDKDYWLVFCQFSLPIITIIFVSINVIPLYSMTTIRYVSYFTYFFLLLVAIGIDRLNLHWSTALFCIYLVFFSLMPYYQSEIRMDGEQWVHALEYANSQNKTLVAFGGIEKFIIDYYLGTDETQIYDDSIKGDYIIVARPRIEGFDEVKDPDWSRYAYGVLLIGVSR